MSQKEVNMGLQETRVVCQRTHRGSVVLFTKNIIGDSLSWDLRWTVEGVEVFFESWKGLKGGTRGFRTYKGIVEYAEG